MINVTQNVSIKIAAKRPFFSQWSKVLAIVNYSLPTQNLFGEKPVVLVDIYIWKPLVDIPLFRNGLVSIN